MDPSAATIGIFKLRLEIRALGVADVIALLDFPVSRRELKEIRPDVAHRVEQIKVLRRQARQAVTLAEQREIQEKIQKLERQQRRQRQEIFKAEDEIIEKRDQLIDSLERQLAHRTGTETLFTIRWAVT